jgi:uncharacterized protein (TIGR00266 family)
MQTEVLYGPAYALARVTLDPHEVVRAESGAMVGMSADIELQTSTQGGFLKALKRSALGGESFFINTFHASAAGGEVTFAPSLPGDILILNLQHEEYRVQAGGYLASAQGIEVDTKWGGSRSFFGAGGNFFMLNCRGTGPLIVASYGALHHVELGPGQKYTVDTGHVVAFSQEMGFDVRRIGGMKSLVFSGEGFVVDLTGPGSLYLQTRSQPALIGYLSQFFGTSEAN